MEDYKLKVSTGEIRTKAQQITSQRAIMEELMGEFSTKIASLETCFKSQSGTDYGMQYQNVTKNVNGALDTLQKHINNLLDVASSYEQLEANQLKKSQSLSTDNIFV